MTLEELYALIWENFKGMVREHYFPQSYCDQKETEFLYLKQGTMSMVEYEGKFNQLSLYTPYLVDIKGKMARCFEKGLCREITGILASLELSTFAEVSRYAKAISTSLGLEAVMPR